MERQATAKEIRDLFSHGKGNRRVRIGRDGHVTYFGSTRGPNLGEDFWHEARYMWEYKVIDGNVVHT